MTGTPVFGDDGTISMVIINERDLTRLNDLRAELQQTRNVSNTYQQELTAVKPPETPGTGNYCRKQSDETGAWHGSETGKSQIRQYPHSGRIGYRERAPGQIYPQQWRTKENFLYSDQLRRPAGKASWKQKLFGYEKGAFTGARDNGKAGLMELAQGGTLFLDEIGELPLIVQAKLLKCLDEREFVGLGGLKPIKIDLHHHRRHQCPPGRTGVEPANFEKIFFTASTPSPSRFRPCGSAGTIFFELTRFFLEKI